MNYIRPILWILVIGMSSVALTKCVCCQSARTMKSGPMYRLELLPTPQKGNSNATFINRKGLVAGYIVDKSNVQRACVWEGKRLIVLPLPDKTVYAEARGISEAGVLVGIAGSKDRKSSAVMWTSDHTAHILKTMGESEAN